MGLCEVVGGGWWVMDGGVRVAVAVGSEGRRPAMAR